MASFDKVVKSKLKFKGALASKGLPSSSSKKRSFEASEDSSSAPTQDSSAHTIRVLAGEGRITSSGTTVHGHETKFMDQLSVGDAIIVRHPTSLQDETKIVRMVLSNISIGISSAFSTDIISTTSFQFIKAPKELIVSPEEEANKALQKKHADEVAAFGTYASKGGEEIVYRVKKPGAYGGYAIVKESSREGAKSREELLDFRTKKKADRWEIRHLQCCS